MHIRLTPLGFLRIFYFLRVSYLSFWLCSERWSQQTIAVSYYGWVVEKKQYVSEVSGLVSLCSLKAFFYDSLCDLSQKVGVNEMKWSTLSKCLCAVEILNELCDWDSCLFRVCCICMPYVKLMLVLMMSCSFSLNSLLCYYFAFCFSSGLCYVTFKAVYAILFC